MFEIIIVIQLRSGMYTGLKLYSNLNHSKIKTLVVNRIDLHRLLSYRYYKEFLEVRLIPCSARKIISATVGAK